MVVTRYPWNYAAACLIIFAVMLSLSGCVYEQKQVTPKVTPTPPPVITMEENKSQPLVKVQVEEIRETESEWMFRNHGKYLHENWSFNRLNVTGDKDLVLNIEVYAYRLFKTYHESGADSWGTNYWFPHVAPSGQMFLFVFLREEMEGTNQRNDPRMWGFGPSSFAVQIGSSFAEKDDSRNPCVAIRELQTVGNFNDDYLVNDFGKLRVESLTNPSGKSEYSSTQIISTSDCKKAGSTKTITSYSSVPGEGGIDCQDQAWLRMGKSNQWDGFLVYRVPEKVTLNDIRVVGSFGGMGSAWWTLKERT